MKRSRFSQEQIMAILREQEASMSTVEVCRLPAYAPASSARARGRKPQEALPDLTGRSGLWCASVVAGSGLSARARRWP
jgi:hypothetical protein